MTAGDPLKLSAADTEDLSVIAACLQDSLVPVNDMRFLPGERRFVLVANRFRWEDAGSEQSPGEDGAPVYDRVHCGVCFEHVIAVRQSGLDQRRRGQIVSFLTVTATGNTIDLVFSAGATIRLEVERLLCHLQDLGEPWPTRWRPVHPLDE